MRRRVPPTVLAMLLVACGRPETATLRRASPSASEQAVTASPGLPDASPSTPAPTPLPSSRPSSRSATPVPTRQAAAGELSLTLERYEAVRRSGQVEVFVHVTGSARGGGGGSVTGRVSVTINDACWGEGGELGCAQVLTTKEADFRAVPAANGRYEARAGPLSFTGDGCERVTVHGVARYGGSSAAADDVRQLCA